MNVMQHAISPDAVAGLEVIGIEQENPTIYFLMSGEQVVYIGKTMRIRARVAEHAKEKAGSFDAVRFFHVNEDELCAAEVANIVAFDPPMNGKALDTRGIGFVSVNTALAKIKNRPKKCRIINFIRGESSGWIEFRGSVYAEIGLIERAVCSLMEVSE